MSLPKEIYQELETQFGLRDIQVIPIGGGCIHNARKLQAKQGTYFLKYNDLSSLANFQAEQKGLSHLAELGKIRIPQIKSCIATKDYACILMEFIVTQSKAEDYWEDLGQKLALLHLNTQEEFGLDHNNFIGSLPQCNQQHQNGIDFFIQERLEPMLSMAIQKRAISEEIREDFEKLYKKLPDLLPQESPSLLHGDLWGGNILTDEQGHACFIDPAIYYGYREMELAFMTLFDSQPLKFYEHYHEIYPLEQGFGDRFDIYNLYPLLVHVNLFGGSYVGSVQRILKSLL